MCAALSVPIIKSDYKLYPGIPSSKIDQPKDRRVSSPLSTGRGFFSSRNYDKGGFVGKQRTTGRRRTRTTSFPLENGSVYSAGGTDGVNDTSSRIRCHSDLVGNPGTANGGGCADENAHSSVNIGDAQRSFSKSRSLGQQQQPVLAFVNNGLLRRDEQNSDLFRREERLRQILAEKRLRHQRSVSAALSETTIGESFEEEGESDQPDDDLQSQSDHHHHESHRPISTKKNSIIKLFRQIGIIKDNTSSQHCDSHVRRKQNLSRS